MDYLTALDLTEMPPDEASQIYKEGINYLQRYRRTKAVKKHQLTLADDVDPITHEVRRDGSSIVGVLEGNPNDYLQMRVDLSHISSIRGLLGRCVADLAEMWDTQVDHTKAVKAELYQEYYRKIQLRHIESKNTDEGIHNLVVLDEKYAAAKDTERLAKKQYFRFYNLREDLQDLENSMKKILEYGKDQ